MAAAAPKASKAKKTQPAKKTGKKGKKAQVFRLQDFLPENERLAVLRRAAERIDDAEATQEVMKAAARVLEAYKDLGSRLGTLEETAEDRIEEIRERVFELTAVQAVQDVTDRLGDRAVEELDELLDRMGLMRKAVHEEEIDLLKKKQKAARKAAETRARKTIERELKKKAASA